MRWVGGLNNSKVDEGLPWVSVDLELGGYLCFLFLAVRSNPTTFHGRFFRSRLDCFQQSWEIVCVYSFHQKQLCSHSAFALSFFLHALMFSFSGAERVPMGNPVLFILFSLAVKFTQDVCPLLLLLSLLAV